MNQQGNKHVSFILILMLLLTIIPAVLASCGSSSNDYAEAEALVAKELDDLKSGSGDMSALTEFSEETDMSEAMISAYAEKLRDFDYVIAGSSKSEDGGSVLVTVDITTYDFGSVYLETWKEWLKTDPDFRIENQFYTDLFTRIASMTVKNYTGQAVVTCTRDEEGNWTTDIKDNLELIDTISGDMITEMKELAEEQ